MTRLKSYIINEVKEINTLGLSEEEILAEVQNFISKVRMNCKPWLKAVKGCPKTSAYRGVSTSAVNGFIYDKRVRTDREPLDTDVDVHDRVDAALERVFGWRGRSTGMFVTGSITMALDYGAPFLVFPIGPFKFIWSTFREDMAVFFAQHGENLLKYSDEKLDQLLIQNEYKNNKLCSALSSGAEIMVLCKSYHAISLSVIKHFTGMSKKVRANKVGEKFMKDYIL